MKLQIQTSGKKWCIFVPDFLISLRVIYWMINRLKKQTHEKITLDILKRIFSELRKVKKSSAGWELVHMASADGAEITIIL